MLRKTIATLVMSLLFVVGYSQSTTVNGATDPLLKEITSIKEKAEQVNAAYEKIQLAATGTRGMATEAQTNYDAALKIYLEELQSQLSQARLSVDFKNALEAEIAFVQKIKGGK